MSTRELLTREVSGPVDVLFTKIVAECYTGPRFFFSSFSSNFGLDLMSQLFPLYFFRTEVERVWNYIRDGKLDEAR